MPDTQYFTNIDGKYVKDAEARQQLNDLEDYVESLDQPWQPLEDGYSNFWFELTNDTLSPWLNFSAKTESAVIDWGDGTGEVALTTLTPTHTYSKAGKYVVKVKGVTGIGRQLSAPYNGDYLSILKYIELNDEVTAFIGGSCIYCIGLERIVENSITTIGSNAAFQNCSQLKATLAHHGTSVSRYGYAYCTSLEQATLSGVTDIGDLAFYICVSLKSITIPNTVTTIGASCFSSCYSLNEVHVQSTTPPTVGNNAFQNIASDAIIYVPVGYADTYKAASGWSTYADHIVEEGQTPNRAMLAKFNEKTDEPQDDMR